MWAVVEMQADGGMYLSSSLLFVVTLSLNDHLSIENKVCLVSKDVGKAPSRLTSIFFPYRRFFLVVYCNYIPTWKFKDVLSTEVAVEVTKMKLTRRHHSLRL